MHTYEIEDLAKHIATKTGIDNEDYLKEIIEEHFKNSIYIGWEVDDVKTMGEKRGLEISDKEARDILDFVLEKHDAEFGVSWVTIDCAIDEKIERAA